MKPERAGLSRATGGVMMPSLFAEAIADQLHRADLILTSGGVSMGAYDTVKEVFTAKGTVEFTKVAMHPGMPQGHGFVADDDR
jgi:molybdopterin molybdotransferase